jgi:hypothetical protein
MPFAKRLATGLSIGTGGSGGIFGPGMVIGAFVGAAMMLMVSEMTARASSRGAPTRRSLAAVSAPRGGAVDAPVSRSVDATAPSVSDEADVEVAIDALPEGHPWLTVLDGVVRCAGSWRSATWCAPTTPSCATSW